MSVLADLGVFDHILVLIMFLACILPYISAYMGNTSMALATILSLMLVSFVQFAISIFQGVPVEMSWPVSIFGIMMTIVGKF